MSFIKIDFNDEKALEYIMLELLLVRYAIKEENKEMVSKALEKYKAEHKKCENQNELQRYSESVNQNLQELIENTIKPEC